MGLIVDFTNRTVKGTSRWGSFVFDDQLQITDSNETTVAFGGSSKFLGMGIVGSIDRMSGDLRMFTIRKGEAFDYTLKCKPAQRMF